MKKNESKLTNSFFYSLEKTYGGKPKTSVGVYSRFWSWKTVDSYVFIALMDKKQGPVTFSVTFFEKKAYERSLASD